MVLVEVGAGSLRRNNYDPRNNEVSLKMYLDTIEGLIATYQQRMCRYYNNKVYARPFKVGNLILRKLMPYMKVFSHRAFGAN